MKSPQRMLNGKRPLQTAVLINHYNLLAKDETCLCDMRMPCRQQGTREIKKSTNVSGNWAKRRLLALLL